MRSLTIGAALCGLIACVSAIDPIEAKGNKFFHKDGSQYFIKGMLTFYLYDCFALTC